MDIGRVPADFLLNTGVEFVAVLIGVGRTGWAGRLGPPASGDRRDALGRPLPAPAGASRGGPAPPDGVGTDRRGDDPAARRGAAPRDRGGRAARDLVFDIEPPGVEDDGQLPATPERPARPLARLVRLRTGAAGTSRSPRCSHRPRRLGAPIAAAVAVIVLVTGLAIAGAHSRSHPPATTTTIPRHGGSTGTTVPRTTTTTTTVPPTFTTKSMSGNVASYTLPFASYTLIFTASNTGSCYIQITNSTGLVPYAQVLDAGKTEQMVLSGYQQGHPGRPGVRDRAGRPDPGHVCPTPLPAPLDIFDLRRPRCRPEGRRAPPRRPPDLARTRPPSSGGRSGRGGKLLLSR